MGGGRTVLGDGDPEVPLLSGASLEEVASFLDSLDIKEIEGIEASSVKRLTT